MYYQTMLHVILASYSYILLLLLLFLLLLLLLLTSYSATRKLFIVLREFRMMTLFIGFNWQLHFESIHIGSYLHFLIFNF